ncbi:unnamed protein product [Cuscuta europaea]|uniref:CCHC-type domain-containing protein n=1 Tax=Cuscuta europaea TaxID=41803 RepID=A0A9P0YUZ9_CUSEU|nr:unnamed protein product [Cuscuta europaea]
MANISKREFDVLDLSGQKYLEWKVDALAHLKANALENTIAENNSATPQNKAKAIIFLRHHLHESLKSEYLLVDDPKELWDNLQERYGHQQKVLLPKAQYDWINLRFQDYKSISDYNGALFQITSKLKLCGQKVTDAEMLEKTLSTMHLSNMLLQEQYRQKHFQKYSDLISVLLLAETNNDILMRNHNMRPTGCSPFSFGPQNHGSKHESNATHSGARGHFKCGRGIGRYNGPSRGNKQSSSSYKGKGKQKPHQTRGSTKSSEKAKVTCFKCGTSGHWANECRTPTHLVDLYKSYLKGKNVETNYVNENVPPMRTFNMSDFYMDNNEMNTDIVMGEK